MDNADRVRGLERLADLLHNVDGSFRGKLFLLLNQRAEIAPFDELHGDELDAFGIAQIEDAHDILVRDLAGEQEFLLEAGENGRVGGELGADEFESNGAVEFAVAGFVDGSHAAFAQQVQDFVAAAENVSDLQDCGGAEARAQRNFPLAWGVQVNGRRFELHRDR